MENTIVTQDRLVEVRYLMRLLSHLQATMSIACGQADLSRGTAEYREYVSFARTIAEES